MFDWGQACGKYFGAKNARKALKKGTLVKKRVVDKNGKQHTMYCSISFVGTP